jgi:8-oxo-dGTP diphosphatase
MDDSILRSFDDAKKRIIESSSHPIVEVAAAALIDSSQRILVTQRPEGKDFAGLWEFPGGKIEHGETPEWALRRELQEELGITIDLATALPLTFVSHSYPRFHLLMLLYTVTGWQGECRGYDNQAFQWVEPAILSQLAMPPADVPLVGALQQKVGKIQKNIA